MKTAKRNVWIQVAVLTASLGLAALAPAQRNEGASS